MRTIFITLSFFCAALGAGAQVIYLNNASFEGEPQDATVPVGWFPCAEGTTPDILPGPWGVYEEAAEGETYVGLITREDGSWESIGQRLSAPLKKGDCYVFSIDLARSGTYADYNEALRLRIWGGRRKCDQTQLLFESPLIESSDWTTYTVDFFADKDLHYIILEAFHEDDAFGRRGNLLIDNISPIKKCARAYREEAGNQKPD